MAPPPAPPPPTGPPPLQRPRQLGPHLFQLARRLQPIVPDALKSLRQDVLHHPSNKRLPIYRHRRLLPLTQVILIPIRHFPPLSIILDDPRQPHRRADHVLHDVPRVSELARYI